MQPFTLSARFYPPDLLNNNSLSPSSSTLCARLDYSHQQGNISLFLRSHFWIISLIPLALPLTSLFFAPLCNEMSRRYCLTLPVPVLSVPLIALQFTHMEVTDAHLYVAKTVLSPHCSWEMRTFVTYGLPLFSFILRLFVCFCSKTRKT